MQVSFAAYAFYFFAFEYLPSALYLLLSDKKLTRRCAAPEGPMESQWKTSVITTRLNGNQMDIRLLIGMVDGVHLKLLGAEGTAVQTQ